MLFNFLVNGNAVNLKNIKEERTSPQLSESPDETSRTTSPDSATSSDEDDDLPTPQSPISEQPSCHPVESNLFLLTKVFPHVEKQILVMILKACENNLIKAIESLAHDSAMKQCTPILPRVPNIQHLPPQIPMQRLPMFQALPHSPTFTSPPRMLQTSGLQFAAFYPGQINPHVTNPLGFNPRVLENPYTIPGNKSPWWAIPNQPFNKKPLFSRSLVFPPELSKARVQMNCNECQNVLNIGDRFCSQCGKMISGND